MSEFTIKEREIVVKKILEDGIAWLGAQLGENGHSGCRDSLRPADLEAIEEATQAIARARELLTPEIEARIRTRQECEHCRGHKRVRVPAVDDAGEEKFDEDGEAVYRVVICPECNGTGRDPGWQE